MTIKEAFELGFLAAYMYSNGENPVIKKIDDFNFLAPIFVGSALKFEATVVFAAYGIVQVMVVAWVVNPKKKENIKASVVHLTFEFIKKDLIPVYPKTYSEALQFFVAKKKLEKIIKEKKIV